MPHPDNLGHCWTCLCPVWTHLYFLSITSCGLDFPRRICGSHTLQRFAFHYCLSQNLSWQMSLWSLSARRVGRKGQGYYFMSNYLLAEFLIAKNPKLPCLLAILPPCFPTPLLFLLPLDAVSLFGAVGCLWLVGRPSAAHSVWMIRGVGITLPTSGDWLVHWKTGVLKGLLPLSRQPSWKHSLNKSVDNGCSKALHWQSK